MLYGEADALNSSYHISYNMLLNMLRVEDADPEFLVKCSFHQFQQEASAPALEVSRILVIYYDEQGPHGTDHQGKAFFPKNSMNCSFFTVQLQYACEPGIPGRHLKWLDRSTKNKQKIMLLK